MARVFVSLIKKGIMRLEDIENISMRDEVSRLLK
jgi:hypothetical protein